MSLFYCVNTPLTGVYFVPRIGDLWNAKILMRCPKLAFVGPTHGTTKVAVELFILYLSLPVIYNLNPWAATGYRLGSSVHGNYLVGLMHLAKRLGLTARGSRRQFQGTKKHQER